MLDNFALVSHKSSGNIIIVSESLDQDQDRRFVRSDLVPKCLQMLSANERCSTCIIYVTVKTFGSLSSQLYTLLVTMLV